MLTLAFFIIIYQTLAAKSEGLEIVSYILISLAFALTLIGQGMNFYKKRERSKKFSDMVVEELDTYFMKINDIYNRRGLRWMVIPGHFWIELHIMVGYDEVNQDLRDHIDGPKPFTL